MSVRDSESLKCSVSSAKSILRWALDIEKSTGVRQTVFLSGPPGIGKTSIVEQLANELNSEGYKGGNWVCHSFRLSQCDPTDLKGVPVYSEVGGVKVCTFAPPNIFPIKGFPESAYGRNVILFLDELPQAVPTIQNLAANIIDGKVGDYEIDLDRCLIVAAGNRREDKAAVFDMPKNVANRIIHLEVYPTFSDWEAWAVENKIDPRVIGFLKANQQYFLERPSDSNQPYCTPRAWHKVSCQMQTLQDQWLSNPDVSILMLSGTIGVATAHIFQSFVKASGNKFEDILEGKSVSVPEEAEVVWSLVFSAVSKINSYIEEVAMDPEYQNSDASKRSKVFVKLLGKERIQHINNLYTWFNQKQIDPGFQVLLNKYQNPKYSGSLRFVMLKEPEFAPSKEAYEAIYNRLVAYQRNQK